tara:strand:+ start:275 stop:490 length:216 start_codon:yes stop_codon:yes gene_type:complete
MEFRDTLNLELSNNSKLAFQLALNKLDATVENPVDIRFLMFMYATNSKDLENPNTLFFKDRVTKEYTKIRY